MQKLVGHHYPSSSNHCDLALTVARDAWQSQQQQADPLLMLICGTVWSEKLRIRIYLDLKMSGCPQSVLLSVKVCNHELKHDCEPVEK